MATDTTNTDAATTDAAADPSTVKPPGQVFDPAERAAREREYERGADMPSYAEPKDLQQPVQEDEPQAEPETKTKASKKK